MRGSINHKIEWEGTLRFQKKWSGQVLFILALTFCLGTALLLTSPQLGEFYLASRLREGMNSKLIHPYFEAAASGVRIFGAILCCGSALFAYRYLFERRDSVQN